MILEISALDAAGHGIARSPDGKVAFVEGALAGERVEAEVRHARRRFDVARLVRVIDASAARREPKCPRFGVCGGCATQHVDLRTQVAAKQRWLEDNLERIGKVKAETMLAPIYGEEWGYRCRARLSARYVENRGGAMVGFRERRSTHVADLRSCDVLTPEVSALIVPLRELVNALSIRERIPQIEVAVGDETTVLVFRHLLPFTREDEGLLENFHKSRKVHVWLQPKGPETAHPAFPEQSSLYYALPEFGVRIAFGPTDFTQVNAGVNRMLVSRALRLLDPQPGERVADLFCGLGNFSLPLAARGAQVVGFEGSASLVERARANAKANALVAQFEVLDLFQGSLKPYGRFEKVLLDPPREGAVELVKSLGETWPRRVLYVSCDPATLARDAGILVHTKGFRLLAAGVVNMFPHTAHIESIAVFER
jgi:23S rRNA (uracil1939-C5)-methyltransferase